MSVKHISQPIQIGPMKVKNRFVVPPMGNNFANSDGTWSDQSVAYYEERAKGGFGLITIEATVVHKGAKGGPLKPCLYDDASIPSLKRITDACHSHGACVSIQLQNAGPEGNAKNAGAPIQAASPIQGSYGRDVPEEVPTEEVYELVKGYGDAAERAMKGGVDAVEIHMAHGYLVSSFISPRTNKRVDEFGGSFENRMRFPRLIVEEVKKRVGGKVAILARINSSDEVEGGMDVHDSAAVAAYLEECGVECLHVSRAVHIKDEFMWAPTTVHGGFSAELATEIKRAVEIPIITVGRFTEPQYADLLIKEGRADLVAFGRQSLADPHTPNKAMNDDLGDLTPCIACLQGCTANMYQGKPIRCLVNPFLGFELEGEPAAKTKKKVLVAGGGPAGLCAAFIAAERGHEVTLYESSNVLGGNMRIAAFPPGKGDITNLVRSYIVRCHKSGVDIVMNTAVTPELVREQNPDEVIVATGSKTLIRDIPGADSPEILHAGRVLTGQQVPGKKVLVVGGGLVGTETADFLGELGYDVTLLATRSYYGVGMIGEHKKFVEKNFAENHVKVIYNARASEFLADGVDYKDAIDGSMHAIRGFDNVVMALGYQSYDELTEPLREAGVSVHTIGDAVKARRCLNATEEARQVAMEL